MNNWFNIAPHEITLAILVLVIPWIIKRILRWAISWNVRWSLRFNRAELTRFLKLRQDPGALQCFLLQHVLWALTFIGMSMMFAPVTIDAVGMKLTRVVWFVLGSLIYVIGAHALGTLHHLLHHPEKSIARLERRIKKLEVRMGSL
ncbi:MAG: hypothetical protein ABIQ36_10735 [Rhodanobacter sp.]